MMLSISETVYACVEPMRILCYLFDMDMFLINEVQGYWLF